jgi:flagellar hook-length control protein FliK
MINVNDRNLTNNFFEGTFQGQSEISKDPFESIFNSKIKNTAQLFKEESFQIENKYKSNALNSFKKTRSRSVINISSSRQDLLNKAEFAKAMPDKDTSSAKALLKQIESNLSEKPTIKPKSFRIKKDELMRSIKGLRKLDASPLKQEKASKNIAMKSNEEFDRSNNETKSSEEKPVVLQFNDARVTFKSEKTDNNSPSEYYQVEVAAVTKSNVTEVSSENADAPNLLSQLPDSKTSTKNIQTDSTAPATIGSNTTDQNAVLANLNEEPKNKTISKDKIIDLVKETSEQTAKVMASDVDLKMNFQPFEKSTKQEFADKVIIANQESMASVIAEADPLIEGVDKIVPSGNLKELLNSQSGALLADNPLVSPAIENIQTLGLKENIIASLDSLSPEATAGIIKEKTSVNEQSQISFGNGKGAQNTPSASVLERINQVAMVQKISKKIQLRQLKEYGIVNIQLDPPELGKLLVKLTIKDKEIKVSILAESESAHDMLKQHKQVFIKAMKENGLDISEFDVNTRSNFNQSSSSQMNENKEHLKNQNLVAPIKFNKKENNNDSLQVKSGNDYLAEGYRISFIA